MSAPTVALRPDWWTVARREADALAHGTRADVVRAVAARYRVTAETTRAYHATGGQGAPSPASAETFAGIAELLTAVADELEARP